jgi:glycosyltransferase involved in cell wall biosynthesis
VRLLLAARRFPPDVCSGTETVFEALYRLAKARHDVRLVAGFMRSRDRIPSEAVAVDLREKEKAYRWVLMGKAIRKEARDFCPDVVLANNIEVPPTGVPTICLVHDLNFGRVADRALGTRMRARFYAERAKRLDAVVAVSVATAGVLTQIGVPAELIHVIHNGVDLDVFRPVPAADDGVVRIAYPARILPAKGQHHAIDAVARLPRGAKERVRLTIAGAVVDRVYLEQLRVQAFNQPVDIVPDPPAIAPVYQAADIVVFPTELEEGFGFTAVEAMACGRPVVWFDQPAIREATGGVGVPVPRGDVLALRAAIQGLVDDPARRRAIGNEGREFCERHRTWPAAWDKYEQLLRTLAR